MDKGLKGESRYYLDTKRFIILASFLMLIFLTLMFLLYLKADEITKNPCQICAKKIGNSVICTVNSGTEIMTRTFEPNFTIHDGRG